MHRRTASRSTAVLLRGLASSFVIAACCVSPADAQQAPPNRFEQADSQPQQQQQQRSIDYSDAYYKRLTIHRIGSYIEFPLFGAEYLLGNELMNGSNPASWVKPTHVIVAGTLGALFAVNTVTGVMNLYEARKDPENRVKRYLHTALMLGADAGFAYTGLVTAGEAGERGGDDDANQHRSSALVSMGVATAGTLIMWLWKDKD